MAGERAMIYDLNPAHWLELTCNVVRRNLSRDEWLIHFGDDFDYECTCEAYPPGDGWPHESCASTDADYKAQ